MALRGRTKAVAFFLVAILGVGLIGGVSYAVSADVRTGAVGLFERVGADDTLTALAADPDEEVRMAAGNAVARRGAPAVPALVRRLDSPVRNDRVAAVALLGRLGPDARDAAPTLKRLVWDDPDRSVRKGAAFALYQVAGSDPEVTTSFIRLLETGDDTGRVVVADVLGRLGDQPGEVVPALARALRDRHAEVRQQAATALGRFGPRAEPAAAALAAAVHDPDPIVRREVVGALERIAMRAKGQP